MRKTPLVRTGFKKKPKQSISKLKHKLDAIYSKYRRLSCADKDGYCICITCGKKLHWTMIHNGHYIHRAINSTRYYDKNNHPQCPGCNLFGNGRPDIYAIRLIELYGKSVLEELHFLRNRTKQFKAFDLEYMIEEYTKKFEELEEKIAK